MKKLILVILIITFSCKNEKKENVEKTMETQTFSLREKIANAHGFEHWKHVSKIAFTFNVDRDSSHFERSWFWKPKTNDVILISDKDSIYFNRKSVDSISLNADKEFINDKFWLLAPFQFVWDKSATVSEPSLEEAPISKQKLNKITLTYPNQGGYTPGDAYDFYYGDDFLIKEWGYRKENAPEPSLITTWENYQDFSGIKIGLNHKKKEGHWNLYFTNVKVEFN